MASNAVDTNAVSAVLGYQLTGGDFSTVTPNLPQRINLLGESNIVNQSGLVQGEQISSLEQAGSLYGFGCPIYEAIRILKPAAGGGVGSIPVFVYPMAEDAGGDAQVKTVTFSGIATDSGLLKFLVNGRGNLDGQSYSFSVVKGETSADIRTKMLLAFAGVLGSPYIPTANVTPEIVDLTTKWQGETAQQCNIQLEPGTETFGISVVFAETTAGTGTPSHTASIDAFGEEWTTIVVNCLDYTSTPILDALEGVNGKPSATVPTGNYGATIMRPFIAFTGSTDNSTLDAITTARKEEVTNAFCPAPASLGLSCEAAANYAVLQALNSQNTPHLDIGSSTLPDMPVNPNGVALVIKNFLLRDEEVKKGASTVKIVSSKFVVVDFVTTYRPDGILVPQHRYVRDLGVDFNWYFGYHLLEQIHVEGHVIVGDNDDVEAEKIVKPKMWIAVIDQYIEDTTKRALTTDPDFTSKSIVVVLGTSNPNRLETSLNYKRSGTARIASTTVKAGFNFGE